MVPDRLLCPRRRGSILVRAGVMACAITWVSSSAFAGQPLVLDTQTGISDGQSGLVLQNAPLSHAPMVAAQQPTAPAAPAGLAPDSSQPYIVAPYVEVPGGGRPNPPPRPPHSGHSSQPHPSQWQVQPRSTPQ